MCRPFFTVIYQFSQWLIYFLEFILHLNKSFHFKSFLFFIFAYNLVFTRIFSILALLSVTIILRFALGTSTSSHLGTSEIYILTYQKHMVFTRCVKIIDIACIQTLLSSSPWPTLCCFIILYQLYCHWTGLSSTCGIAFFQCYSVNLVRLIIVFMCIIENNSLTMRSTEFDQNVLFLIVVVTWYTHTFSSS